MSLRTPGASALGLAFCGTLLVYNVDRLRDLPRDRKTSPLRSAFVATHRRALTAVTAAAGATSAALAFQLGPRAIALLAPVLVAGLFHRRLKRFGWWKPVYISGAWTAVVVGLPAALAKEPRHLPWIGAIVGATVVANVIASNIRDGEAISARFGARVPLRVASGFAAFAALCGIAAPDAVRPLILIPLLTLAALARFRADEHYGLVVVDGALLVGALLALPLLAR